MITNKIYIDVSPSVSKDVRMSFVNKRKLIIKDNCFVPVKNINSQVDRLPVREFSKYFKEEE